MDESSKPPAPPLPPPVPPASFTWEYQFNDDGYSIDTLIVNMEPFFSLHPDQLTTFSENWNNEREMKRVDSIMKAQEKQFSKHVRDDNLRMLRQENVIIKSNITHKRHPSPPGVHPEEQSRFIVHTAPAPGPPRQVVVRNDLVKITRKAKKIKDVIKKMAVELETKPLPLDKRINRDELEKSLKKAMADKDIHASFEYAVLAVSNDSNPLPIHSSGFKPDFLKTTHRVSMFPNDIFAKPSQLLVYFPGQKSLLLHSVSMLMLSSVFFTIIIVITSILSIFIMLRQKRISEIKTDFINNMTHEFKTPIATISIAVDSINNPKVIDEPDKIKSFTRIIREENNRMNTRVEQVLQMALLDSRDFRLNPKKVDINELVKKIAENIRLQVENRGGKLEVEPGAGNSTVEADEAHLTNVFINLLDNANKYSPEKPSIRISTFNKGEHVIVSVEDKGIGMNPETQRKIFDKFFRVTSGNIHNVKGFGLGLSYAKAIIMAHKGELNVTSDPGKGSRFDVILPLNTEDNESYKTT
jgi:two-component system, OmpR family, phosphate regulon sensor histidine kinase PhoR